MNRRLTEKAKTLLSKERGAVLKKHEGRISVCLVYPNEYGVGMSSLGFQGIYKILNSRDDVVCERAFFPDDSDISEYVRTKTPVFSVETQRPLSDFDIVAFSISFENDYPNIAKILNISRIPLYANRRNRYHPLLIAGGVCPSCNPEPVAPFLDAVFIGEAEESIHEFLDVYKQASKRSILKIKAAEIEGIYIPEFYGIDYREDGTISKMTASSGAPEKIRRRYAKDISACSMTTAILTPEAEFSEMYLVEAMRGCPWKCRFCLVGHVYHPVRRKDFENMKSDIAAAKEISCKVGIVGPSLSDYPYIKDILSIDGVDFSITSLRASTKSADVVALLKGYKSVSIAPEAGTERMRRIVNKKISEDDIVSTAGLILNSGIKNLRLYFMIGLPEEKIEDAAGIVSLVRKIRERSVKGNIIMSISIFVPKPFTPFQWHGMESIRSIKEKLKLLKKEALNLKNVKIFHDAPKYAYMQGLFSMGDRRIAKVIEHMAETDDFSRACIEAGINIDYYIFRNKVFDEMLPWGFIECGFTKEHLWREYEDAMSYANNNS